MATVVHGPLEFVLPFVSPSQNVALREHWSKRNALRDKAMLWLIAEMRRRGIARVASPWHVHMEIVRHRAARCRELDFDNLVAGLKPIVDAMVRCGLLWDDSPKHLRTRYFQGKRLRGYPHGATHVRLVCSPDVDCSDCFDARFHQPGAPSQGHQPAPAKAR